MTATRLPLTWKDPATSTNPNPECDICTQRLPTLGLICSIEELTQVSFPPGNQAIQVDGPWFLCHTCRKMMDIETGAAWVEIENVKRCHYLKLLDFAGEFGHPEIARGIFLIPTSAAPDFDFGTMVEVLPGTRADFRGNIVVEIDKLMTFLGVENTHENSARAYVLLTDMYGKPFSRQRKQKRPNR